MRFVIEVDEIPGAHVHRAHAEAYLASIDPIEVDKPLERALQVLGIVEARGLEGAVRVQPGRGLSKREKAFGPRNEGVGRTQLVGERARQVAFRSEGKVQRGAGSAPSRGGVAAVRWAAQTTSPSSASRRGQKRDGGRPCGGT